MGEYAAARAATERPGLQASPSANAVHESIFSMPLESAPSARHDSSRLVDTSITLQDAVTKGIPGAVAGGLDTVLQTLNIVDENDVPEILTDISKPLGNFYTEHREGLQTIGDIGVSFIPIIGATKLIRAGSILHKGFKRIDPTGQLDKFIFSTGKSTHSVTAKARREQILFARKGQRSFKGDGAPISVLAETRKAKFRNAFDLLKEGVAADVAIWGLQGDSKTFFPEEMTAMENIALFGAFDLAFAAGGYGVARHALKKHIVDVAGPVAAMSTVRNSQRVTPEQLALQSFETPNQRSVAITLQSASINTLKQARATETDSTVLKNIDAEIKTLESNVAEIIGRMANDSPIAGLTNKAKLNDAEARTATQVLKTDEGSFVNVSTIEHFDPETTPAQFIQKKLNLESEARGQLLEMHTLQTLDEEAFLKAGGNKKIKEIENKLQLLEDTDAVVLEPGGGMMDLLHRKPIFQDTPSWFTQGIKVSQGGGIVDKTYKTTVKNTAGLDREVAVTEGLHILLPDAKSQMINNVPSVELMPSVNSVKQLKDFKLTLVDIGEDWHYKTGKRGQPIFNTLDTDLQREISNWTGSSGSSKLREWSDAGDPRFQQIMHAYADAGLHQRLREVANPDGTITLYRGMSKKEAKEPTNDVVSMAADPEIARKFARAEGAAFTLRIPVDDVVMVIGGLGRETEYIVKGHRNRKLGETIISQDNFEALGLMERTAVFAATQKALSNWKPGSAKINIGASDHWVRLDSIAELAAKHNLDLADVASFPEAMKRGGGAVSVDDIEFAALREKFFEFDRLMRLHEIAASDKAGLLKLKDEQIINIHDMVRMLNLPEDEAGGFAPIVQLFLATRKAGSTGEVLFDSEFKNLAQVKEAMVRDIAPTRIGEALAPNLRFRGQMLARPTDEQPVTLVFREKPEGYITREELLESGIAQRENLLAKLMQANPNNAPLVATILGIHRANPEMFAQSLRSFDLAEGSQFGQGTITQAGFANRDNPVMQAVDALGDLADKEVRQYVEAVIKQHEASFNKILGRQQEGDLLSFRMFVNAKNEGWELANVRAFTEDDKIFFYNLDQASAKNKALWKQRFGTDMPKDAMLPAPRTKKTGDEAVPLGVSALARDTAESISTIDGDILHHLNFLNHAKGRRQINFRPHHTPPQNISDQTVLFLADNTGKARRMVTGSNGAEAMRKANKEIEAFKQEGTHYSIVTEDDMGRYFDTLNEVFGRPENFANPRLQTGAGIGGKLTEQTVEIGPQFLKDMINTQVRMYDSIFKETRALIYEPELNYAKQAKSSSAIVDTKRFGAGKLKARETVWDDYSRAVYQKGKLNAESNIGRGYFFVENLYDTMLNKVFQAKVDAFEATKYDREFGSSEQRAAFQSLENTLGEFNPFTDLTEFVSRSTKIPTPPSLRKHAATMNKIVGFTALRLLDAGMAVINLTSLAATMPPVIRTMTKAANETEDEFAKRTYAYGFKAGPDVAMWSPTRATTSGIHFMFTPEGHEVWKEAAKRGLLQQEIAERMAVITAPTQGYLTRQVENAATTLSWLTDKSETLSRGIAFMTGYNFARNGMKLGKEEALTFAHNFGNKTIADFRPSNRPQMFQGATGLPLGLFTTFMWNFLQRIGSNIESKQYAALMTQAGMQFSLFGADSLPGFEQFARQVTDNYDGSVNMIDGMSERFGTDFTEWFLNGTLSTIPKMFGSEDGIAFMSRAQIATPLTAGPLTGNIPAWTTIKKVANTLRETAAMVRTRDGFSASQMAEILARYSLTRSYGNAIEIYQGYSTDKVGQVIEADTQTAMGVAARVLGSKPLRANQIAREFARNRASDRKRTRLRGELRQAVRADARDDSLSKEEFHANFRQHANRYTKIGGDPADIGNFFAEQLMAGTVEKVQLEALRAAKNSRRQGEAIRLMELMIPENSVVENK